MKTTAQILVELYNEARTRFSNQLTNLTEADLRKKLSPSPNSVGFLIRHIGEVELLFAKNVFGDTSIRVTAKTVISKEDTGEWTDLEELKTFVADSLAALTAILEKQSNEDWESTVVTKEFGTKTKAEAFGRIVSIHRIVDFGTGKFSL